MKRQRLTMEADDHMGQVPYIPEEIFEEILSRLPVKNLMQFKSVCPSWHTLISDPRFSKLHLKQSVNQNRMRFMYSHDCHSTLAYQAPVDGTSTTNRPIHMDESNNGVNFLASCNGLVCISNAEDDFFLWNPSTKEARKIPGSTIEFPAGSCTWASVFFGLGYHSASDDYKLVRVSMFDSQDFQTEVKIYSRNTDTWKRISDFPYDFPLGRPGVFVSGRLHWIVSMWDNGVHFYKVAVLDVEKETYGLIQLPEFGRETLYFDIGTLQENLVMFYSSVDCSCDIWILKEYGKTESWTRTKITTHCVTHIEAFIYFQPLCLLKPGEILLRIGAKKVAKFDVKEKLCSNFLMPHMKESRIVSFVESLVSPNAHLHT